MSFKIGFSVETENENKCKTVKKEVPIIKKSVVQVYFPDRHLTCSYFNDKFDLKCGDLVFVEGKLEGLQGQVTDVNYNFKIRLSDYKRILSVAETNVVGKFHFAGSHLITADKNAINYDKIITWFKAPSYEDEEFVFSYNSDEVFNLEDFGKMKIDSITADKGYEYFIRNQVEYIELDSGKGRAIVTGSKPYEVEFNYENGQISGLVCDCYCTGTCKHEFATMLQLKETLDFIEKEYSDINSNSYFAAVNKSTFFKIIIDSKKCGTLSLS